MTTGFLVLFGLAVVAIVVLILLSGVRVIPNTRIGIVEKRFSFAEAIQQSQVDVVPRVVVGADKESGSGNIMEALLAMLLSDRFAALANNEHGQRSEEAERLRSEIRKSMTGKTE